jgi:HPt (histidine-containing phosphotransfer) domain-containing protein
LTRVSADYLAQLQALRSLYARDLPRKGRGIAQAASVIAEGWHRRYLASLYRRAHRLTGSAAIYGFPGVSRAASALEDFMVSAMQEESGRPKAKRRQRLRALAAALEKACIEGSRRGRKPPVTGAGRGA